MRVTHRASFHSTCKSAKFHSQCVLGAKPPSETPPLTSLFCFALLARCVRAIFSQLLPQLLPPHLLSACCTVCLSPASQPHSLSITLLTHHPACHQLATQWTAHLHSQRQPTLSETQFLVSASFRACCHDHHHLSANPLLIPERKISLSCYWHFYQRQVLAISETNLWLPGANYCILRQSCFVSAACLFCWKPIL